MGVSQSLIRRIDKHYELESGFLGRLRSGAFDAIEAADLLAALRELDLGDEVDVNRRLVSLLWYMPLFIEWQERRVPESNQLALRTVLNEVTTELERVLGVP